MKTIQKIRVELSPRKEVLQSFVSERLTFNSIGQIIDSIEFNPDGSIQTKKTFRYFEDGDILEFIDYDSKDELVERHRYEKDKEGSISKSIFEYENSQKIIKQHQFNEITRTEDVLTTDQDGDFLGREIYIFDESDNVITEKKINSDGEEVTVYRKKYDELNQLKQEDYFLEGKLQSSSFFTFNSKNQVVKTELKDFYNESLLIDIFEYDLSGNQVYSYSKLDGVLIFENKCLYDSNNNLIEEDYFQIDPFNRSVIEHSKIVYEELPN